MKSTTMTRVITERRVIFPTDVRQMCISHNFYTNGTNTEYSAMLDKVAKNYDDISNETLCEIAEDILAHSSEAQIDGMDIGSMMYLIVENCCHHCFDVH